MRAAIEPSESFSLHKPISRILAIDCRKKTMSYNAATLARRLTEKKYSRHESDDEMSSLSLSSSSTFDRGKM